MSIPRTNPWLDSIPPYSPGKSKEEICASYGVTNPIKMASNENPLGPSPKALEAVTEYMEGMNLYPDPQSKELRHAAGTFFNCPEENIIAGNGSDEIIDLACRTFLSPADEVIIPETTFSYYKIASLSCGARIVKAPMDGFDIDTASIVSRITPATKMIFVANPNNPTGTCLPHGRIDDLIKAVPKDVLVVIDEAYASFARQEDFRSSVELTDENVFVIKTLSKSHGLAGLRVGFGIGCPGMIACMNRIRGPFNVNLLAIKAGSAALGDNEFLKKTLELNWAGLDYMYSECDKLGLEYVRSETNFLLIRFGDRAKEIYEKLLSRGIITRYMNEPGLTDHIRVSIGLMEENEAFIKELKEVL